ncbi:DUF3552 domain-containing protein [Candidatus Peregrinibacteria bacterium]|nr:DUF3552 domain-containing protein [Candidatus Peregrinibacteria bacterium]
MNILLITSGIAIGLISSWVFLKGKNLLDVDGRKKNAAEILKKSEEEVKKITGDLKEYVQKRKESFQHEFEQKEARLKKTEETLSIKEEYLKKKEEKNKEINLAIATANEEIHTSGERNKQIKKEIVQKLADRAGRDVDSLKRGLLDEYASTLTENNREKLAKIEDRLRENALKEAKKIIITAIQRISSPTSVEFRAVNVVVPHDHVKGKILGRNNENIMELERLVDVDIVFNDLPNTISLSAFMLVERRVAQKTLEKLAGIRGDITPKTVRATVADARKETDDELYEIGKKALQIMGIKNDNKEFMRVVGRLQYRTSYGQNIMKHSMEIGWISAILGSELGLNIQTCKVGGFLHDLGKAIDQDPNNDKPHDVLSRELMEKFGFSWEETHAAWTHHDAIPQETAEAFIVKAADAISAGRPGARQESLQKYLERVRALQGTAESYPGVRKAYAISAGRELRVEVEPEQVTDENIYPLAKTIAARIQKELTYPGQIKVNVIRRTKHTELAR